jgi:hypothetical protein
MEKGKGREVVVSALQFACTDDVAANLATAERSSYSCFFLSYLFISFMYDFKVAQVLIFFITYKEFFHPSNGFC